MADIDSISFADGGWRPVREEERLREWRNERGDRRIYEFVPHADPPPFDPRDVRAVRSFERERAARTGGALVEADLVSRRDLLIRRVVTKHPQRPKGLIFVSGIAFTLGGAGFRIRHECPEGPFPGEREAAVAQQLGVRPASPGFVARLLGRKDEWFADPYDPAFRAPLLRSRADDAEWDARFPESPPARARKHVRDLLDSLEIAG